MCTIIEENMEKEQEFFIEYESIEYDLMLPDDIADISFFVLYFGLVTEDGDLTIDASVKHKDRKIVGETIINSIKSFVKDNEKYGVIIQGSTNGRTRIYKRVVALAFEDDYVKGDLKIRCMRNSTVEELNTEFDKNADYDLFLVY